MKTVRAAMLVLAFFTLACAGSRVKYELLDSGAPTSGWDSDGEDSDGEDSDGNADTDAVVRYTAWNGVEMYEYARSDVAGALECEMIWSVTGTPSTLECPDCLFAFDVTLAYDAANSTATDDCAHLAMELTFSYGFIEDYYGYGYPAIAIGVADGETGYWRAWGSANLDTKNDTLRYGGGVIDSAYSGYYTGYVTYYYTQYYRGEALLTR